MFWRKKTPSEKMHHRLKEMFTGKKNVITVTLAFIGAYFIAYPLANIVTSKIGYGKTMVIGVIILILGSYILDTYHKRR